MDEGSVHARSLGVDAIFQYTGSGVQLFSGMVFYIIVARLFSSSGVGAIALFLAVIGLFNIVFSIGLGTATQHFTSYHIGVGDYASVKQTVYKIIEIGFILSAAGLVSLYFLSPFVSEVFLHTKAYTELVKLLSVVLFGNILFGILNGALLGIQNFRISAIINIVIWVVYYFGSVFMAVYLRSIGTIVYGWIIGIVVGVLIELLVVINAVRRYNGIGNSPQSYFIFKYSIPVLFSGLIGYGAAYADRFIVSGLMNTSELGIYNFALLIASSIGFVATPFNNILMPKFSELFGRKERGVISSIFNVSSTLLSVIYVPAALGIAALAPMILDVLAGSAYVVAAIPLQIVMFLSAIFVSQNVLVQAVASVRRTKIFIFSSGGALLSNVAISIFLIPKYGLVGASIGYSSVYAATFIILYYFASREHIVSFDKAAHLKVWLSALVMYISVVYMERFLGEAPLMLPLYIAIGAFIYLVLIRIARIFSRENREIILSLFPERMRRVRNIISFLVL